MTLVVTTIFLPACIKGYNFAELLAGDPEHTSFYHKHGKGRMTRNRPMSFGRFFKPWKWKKKRGRVKQQQHQVAATLAISDTKGRTFIAIFKTLKENVSHTPILSNSVVQNLLQEH